MQYNRMTGNIPAIPSPPTQLASQLAGLPQAQPWAFLPDASRTSPMYNPYASQLNQSIFMPGSMTTDLLGSTGAGGFRLQAGTGHYPGSQQSTANNVLISQASLMSSGVKPAKKVTSQNFKVALSGEPFVPGGCPFQKLMYS